MMVFLNYVLSIVVNVRCVMPNFFRTIKITHFIFVGCYMLTVGTVLYTASFGVGSMQAHGWICQLSFGFFYPIGFTLIFASVLVRTCVSIEYSYTT